MQDRPPVNRPVAQINMVRRRQTYRRAFYVLLAAPLGLGYWVVLLAALVVDLLLFVPRFLLMLVLLLVRWLLIALVWLVRRLGRAVLRFSRFLVHGSKQGITTLRQGLRRRPTTTYTQDPYTAPTVALVSVATRLSTDVAQARMQSAQQLQTGLAGARTVARGARPQAAHKSYFLVTRAAWARLARWERSLCVRFLDIEIPPSTQPPDTTLAYLVAKFPFGVLGTGLAYIGFVLAAALISEGVHWLQTALHSRIALPAEQTLVLIVFQPLSGIAFAAGTLLALNGLAVLWGRFALIAYGGSDTLRQLREAEARAAAEQTKAERAEQSRHDLIINVSHELRTPTASIRGHVESLLLALDETDGSTPSGATLRTQLGIVHREAERLGTLIEELLALARSETDQLQLNIEPVHAADVVDEVYQTLAPLARRDRQVTLVREVQPDLPPLLADRQRLTQVLLNLVRNAITYTPAGGIVSITLARADVDYLLLAVGDTGVGIPPQELERVWERFYRTDQSRARTSGGFGLGLAIVRDLVEAMGGAVAAHSVEGEGSCFEVRLPVAQLVEADPPSTTARQGI